MKADSIVILCCEKAFKIVLNDVQIVSFEPDETGYDLAYDTAYRLSKALNTTFSFSVEKVKGVPPSKLEKIFLTFSDWHKQVSKFLLGK